MSSDAPLMLSVSGMRGWVGKTMTPIVASRFAAAFGSWVHDDAKKRGRKVPHVVVGRDSRPSGAMIEMAAIAGLLSAGCRVTSLGVVSTPGVGVMIGEHKADAGMVITASHNPAPWNGIKPLRHDGCAPPIDDANEIIRRFREEDLNLVPYDKLVPLERDDRTVGIHVTRVLNLIDKDIIRKRKLKVVVESVHGAGGPEAAMLMRELGVELIHLYAEPTGNFPHSPEPTKENLTGLCDAVRKHGADIGFAQDPDADRCAVVDNHGTYIGEEYTLALSVLEVLNSAKDANKQTVVANLSTSRMLEDIAGRFGAKVVRTPVGEANVVAAIQKHNAIIGGEGNGGAIWPKVVYIRDSIVSAALVMQLVAREGKSLSDIIATIPRYAIVKDKVDIKPGFAAQLAPKLTGHFKNNKIDTQDGVRIDWPDRWVHVRPSNTEPIVRFVAEASDESVAQKMIAEVKQCLS